MMIAAEPFELPWKLRLEIQLRAPMPVIDQLSRFTPRFRAQLVDACIVESDEMDDLHTLQDQVVRDQPPMASLRRAFSAEYGRGRPGGQIDQLGGALLKVIGFHVVGVAAQPFVQGLVSGARSG